MPKGCLGYAGVGIRTQVFQGNNRSRACRVSPLCHPGSMQRLGAGCCITVTTIFNIYGSGGCDVVIWVQKSRKPGIYFPFSLHHPHRDQVGGSGNVDRHSCREHHPVPCLHEAGVWNMRPQADGMPDSTFDHGCCRAGDGAGTVRERHGGGFACRRCGKRCARRRSVNNSHRRVDYRLARGVEAPHH